MSGVALEVARSLREQLRLADVRLDCEHDPKALINEIKYHDPVTKDEVQFLMFPPEGWEPPPCWDRRDEGIEFHPKMDEGAEDWFWQSLFIDWLHDPEITTYLVLKARQLGITLLALAYSLWLMLYRPGSTIAAYSYTEEEAFKLTQATFEMFRNLPEVLRDHVELVTPKQWNGIPTEWFRVRHLEGGLLSAMQALPATEKHGHGSRVTFGLMDEMSRQDYARGIYTAIIPATISRGGKLLMDSTANGVSNKETGEGNFFHHTYTTRKQKRIAFKFLPWNLEPTRGEEWYENVAMQLDEVERNQQYPLNENDAFMLSGLVYFPRDALDFYRGSLAQVRFAGQFILHGTRRGKWINLRDGMIEVYEKPADDGEYAIGVDTATGSGADFTSAHVIDLSSGAIVAHFHGKVEAGRAAFQLHYLGKWYNNARIAVERQGGSGEAVITALREGTKERPAYSKLYRHKTFTKGNKPLSEDYGHPMGAGARQTILDGLKKALRERRFPFLDAGTVDELGTFVYKDTKPSPRAEDGCNDDRVMDLALAWEMYRQFGERPEKTTKTWNKRKSKYRPGPVKAGG